MAWTFATTYANAICPAQTGQPTVSITALEGSFCEHLCGGGLARTLLLLVAVEVAPGPLQVVRVLKDPRSLKEQYAVSRVLLVTNPRHRFLYPSGALRRERGPRRWNCLAQPLPFTRCPNVVDLRVCLHSCRDCFRNLV